MAGSHFTLDQANGTGQAIAEAASADLDRGQRRCRGQAGGRALGHRWYINPHSTVTTLARQLEIYRRALDEIRQAVPGRIADAARGLCRRSRDEAIRLARPYLETKYNTYREWGQDKVMPQGDDFDHDFAQLLADRFLIGSAAEVADKLIDLRRRFGVNHLVASLHWPGMPNSLALEQMQILAEEVMPAVRRAA